MTLAKSATRLAGASRRHAAWLLASSLLLLPPEALAAGYGPGIAATSRAETEDWAKRIQESAASGALRLGRVQTDADFPDRRHHRYDQYIRGVRVFGAQVVQQLDGGGETLSVFGRTAEGDGDTVPRLTADDVVRAVRSELGRDAEIVPPVELVLLPIEDRLQLVYTFWVATDPGLFRYFVDASSGLLVLRYDDLWTDSVVGAGTGVWADRKKVAANRVSAREFRTEDLLRPSPILTYDMRFQSLPLTSANLARDDDNDWRDGAVVDAQVHVGMAYDYFFRRHGRRGLDDGRLAIRTSVHVGFFDNASYTPSLALLTFGDGLPGFSRSRSGNVDTVAHEYAHGVTAFTWNGVYAFESGALNEAFSDIMGNAAEWYYQPPGNGRGMADFWQSEDACEVFNADVCGIRSLADPGVRCSAEFGCHPDHYSKRYLGTLDNGGVHINSGIANHAFYLLIEGGTNRTSGIRIAGLGRARRERVEKIFYRGFTAFLTPAARFVDARAATIRAAQELYGASSEEAAQTEAVWTAVGVR
jgi:thermolysin